MMMAEWRKVRGFESRYSVSDDGRVYTHVKNRELNSYISRNGYEYVGFKYKGRKYNKAVHRLVAEAFCKGYSEELDVHHIDADRLNNNSSNLQWVTRSENIADAVKRGTNYGKKSFPLAVKAAKIANSKEVTICDLEGKHIKSYKSIVDAAKDTGVDASSISKCCLGKAYTAGGFMWSFAS